MNLLAPSALALSLLAIPLIAMYFLRLRRKKVRVSSLLPWHAVKQSEQLASPFHKFRRHLLLLLQLLVLALLVLALARPWVEASDVPAHSMVLVIDTSASMGATDVEPTRLGHALAEASLLIDDLPAGDEAMIVDAGASVEVVTPFSRDKGALRLGLSKLSVGEAAGDLEAGMRLAMSLARSRPDVEVVVLSDGGPSDLSAVQGGGIPVRYVAQGRSPHNAGIVALDVRRSPLSDLEQQLFVTVTNFGDREGLGTIEVYLDGAKLRVETQSLPPGSAVPLVVDLPPGSSGLLKVVLAWPGDILPADDVAYAVLDEATTSEVLLVGGDALLARILASDPRIEARRVPVAGVTPELLASADAVLVAGDVPDGLEGLNYAVLGPYAGSPVGFGPPEAAPGVIEWNRSHPLLRYTTWNRVVMAESRPVVDRGGLVPVVDGTTGPLVLAGERDGGRVVQLAFDPLRSDLPLRVSWPVFVLNTVGWLTEDREGLGGSGAVATGRPWVQAVGTGVTGTPRIVGPEGTSPEVRLDDGVLRASSLDRVGIYTVTVGSLQSRFAANLLSEGESHVRPRLDLVLGEDGGGPAHQASLLGRRELWRPLGYLALLLLLLEWAAYHRRKVA